MDDLTANEISHEYRNQRNRQACCRRHCIGLGKRQRREQSALLRLECEHRQETQRDDEQREEQRWPDFRGRIADDAPAVLGRQCLFFDVFVHVLDHHDCRVDHRADGNRDTAQRHDVRVDALRTHDDKRDQNAERQAQNDHRRRPQVEQKQGTNERNDDEFLDERALECVDRALDQVRTIVGRDDLDTFRQALLELSEPRFDGIDGRRSVLAPAHDDNRANDLALTIKVSNTASHLRADSNLGHVGQDEGRTLVVDAKRYGGEIFDTLQVARGTNHVLGLTHFDDRAAGLLVTVPDRLLEAGKRHAESAQLVRVDDNLVLAHHAADRRHFGDAMHRLQFILEEPVLQAAQLGEIVTAGAVDERVLEYPAHAGRIGTQRGCRAFRQACGYLVQVLEYARTRPVEVRAVFEDDVDIGVAEERVPANRRGFRNREHRGRKWVRDLVLHDLRCLAGKRRLDDDLHVGQVGQRVDRCLLHRVNAQRRDHERCDHDEDAIIDRPAY